MDVEQLQRPVEPKKKYRGWLAAAAAFAAVVAVGAAIVLFSGGSDVEPATPTTDVEPVTPTTIENSSTRAPAEIAADFVGAGDNWDAAAIEALLATGATVGGDIAVIPGDYPRLVEFDRAQGTTYRLGTCNQSDVTGQPGTVRVSCLYTSENDWSRALGIDMLDRPPTEGAGVFTFEITDGKIRRIQVQVAPAFLNEVVGPFNDWLEQAHPDDIELMFPVGPRAPWPGNRPLLNPDALALWERYTKEFVDFVTASG